MIIWLYSCKSCYVLPEKKSIDKTANKSNYFSYSDSGCLFKFKVTVENNNVCEISFIHSGGKCLQ